MLKLPKNALKHPRCADMEACFTKDERPLRAGGVARASFWHLDDTLRRALKHATESKHLVQGLESIEKFLAKEAKGLRMMQAQAGQAEAQRLSRLLLLANDGSDRFYHNAESMLLEHSSRTWAVVIDASSETLGNLTTAKGTLVKALLIADRKDLEVFLSDLVPVG